MDGLAGCYGATITLHRLSPSRISQFSRYALLLHSFETMLTWRVDTERPASQAIAFYASFLADSVGSRFIFPSLDVFADYWLDRSSSSPPSSRDV